jgi:predicted PurR-regulated permease PerM
MEGEQLSQPQARRLAQFSLVLLAVVIMLGIVYRSLIVSLAIAFFLAYLLAPIVDFANLRLRMSRGHSSLVLLVVGFSLVIFGVVSLVPLIYNQALNILKQIPEGIAHLLLIISPIKQWLISMGFLEFKAIEDAFAEFDLVRTFTTQLRVALEQLWYSTPTFLGGVINLGLVPIFVFFLLKDLPFLKLGFVQLVPPTLRPEVTTFFGQLDLKLKSVLKGQVIVAFILGILYCLGLSIVGIESALAIGVVAGICRIIPYLDVVVGIGLSLLVIITSNADLMQFVGVGIVFLVVQLLDGMIITPRVIGERAGIHPAIVIASIVAFADWFGFWGVLIAIPFVAFGTVVVQTFNPVYRVSNFYNSRDY